LWRRARHWDAAWQFGGNSSLWGAVCGVTIVANIFRSDPAVFYGWAVLGAVLPVVVLCYGAFVLYGEPRARLTLEFLRPFSREQFVQSVGLAITTALFRFIFVAIVIPGLVFWLRGGLSSRGQVWWIAVVVIAWLPTFLGAALANLPKFETNFLIILWLVLYATCVGICVANPQDFAPYPVGLLCGILLTVGLISLRLAYRTWLNNDADEARTS